MENHNTISEMMQDLARQAAELAPTFGARLDFSESSLQILEAVLGQLEKEMAKTSTASDRSQNELDRTAKVWGAYFGETLRRLWGGDWGVETYPGTVAPVISVDIGGAKLFPIMKVYRRLTQGETESVWKFYQMVREKLAGNTRH